MSKQDRIAAELSAQQLRSYWRAKGHAISTWVEQAQDPKRSDKVIYSIRSDLRNGLPVANDNAGQQLKKAA